MGRLDKKPLKKGPGRPTGVTTKNKTMPTPMRKTKQSAPVGIVGSLCNSSDKLVEAIAAIARSNQKSKHEKAMEVSQHVLL